MYESTYLIYVYLFLTEALGVAIVAGGGAVIAALIGYFTNRSNARSTKDLAIIAAKNTVELALIAANQEKMEIAQDVTHKLINSRMTELLALTRKDSKAEGKLEGKAEKGREVKKSK